MCSYLVLGQQKRACMQVFQRVFQVRSVPHRAVSDPEGREKQTWRGALAASGETTAARRGGLPLPELRRLRLRVLWRQEDWAHAPRGQGLGLPLEALGAPVPSWNSRYVGVLWAKWSNTCQWCGVQKWLENEGALFISAQLSTDAVSALRKVPVLIWL